MTCYVMYAECTKREVCAQPMLFHSALIVPRAHYKNNHKATQGNLQIQNTSVYKTKGTPFQHDPDTHGEKKREGMYVSKDPKKSYSPHALPQVFQENPPLHNATYVFGVRRIERTKKKKTAK